MDPAEVENLVSRLDTKDGRAGEDAWEKLRHLGLADRSYMVRYRACGLLAYSLRREALPPLQTLSAHADRRTAEDAAAAIDAIEHRNHDYFADRGHTGRSFWAVNDSDRQTP